MAINRTSPKKGKIIDIPTVPTIGAATGGAGSASVAFTPATVGGPTFSYTALSNPGSITGTGTTSPITVSGLTAGTSYTFTVRGTNPSGNSEYTSASNSVVPTVITAFESIATASGDGTNFEITFSSIPSTFAHLQIRCLAKSTTGTPAINLRINGDTGSNYTRHRLIGDGTSASATGDVSQTQIPVLGNAGLPSASNTYGVAIYDILDYTNTNKYTTVRVLAGQDSNGSGGVDFTSGLWLNTAVISSLTFRTANSAEPFTTATRFALYGIKGA